MNIGLISHEVLETAQRITVTGFSDIAHYLIANPVISIFICLALGYFIGKVKIKSFTVGATVGTLLVGLLISLILKGAGRQSFSHYLFLLSDMRLDLHSSQV